MSDDIETQKKGYVGLAIYRLEDFEYMSKETDHSLLRTIVQSCPVRNAASHVCLPVGPVYHMFLDMILFATCDKNMRLRFRIYTSLNLDTQYKLMGLGIPVEDIPLTASMTTKTKNHQQWLKNRKMFDLARANGCDISQWIEHPGVNDVLFRRGGQPKKQGNIEFTAVLELKMQDYYSNDACSKERVRAEVIDTVEAKGGRFLEYNRETGLWIQIQDQHVLNEKVHSAFYDHKRRVESKKDRQTMDCETSEFLLDTDNKKRRKVCNDGCWKPRWPFWSGATTTKTSTSSNK